MGGFAFTGIALGTVAALAVFHGMRLIGRATGTEQVSEAAEAAVPARED